MVGSLLSTWIHYQVLSIPLSPLITFQTEKDELLVDSGKAQEEFAVILERNIFNAQKTQIELPTSLPEEEFVAQINTDGEAVEHTLLNIALAGTMIYGERDSFAFISKKDSLNKYVIYGIGECFHAKTILRDEKCVKESVKILKIRDRWVLILYQEKKESLWMVSTVNSGKAAESVTLPNKSQNQVISSQKTTALVVPTKGYVVDEKSLLPDAPVKEGNTFHFQRVWVDEQLANFERSCSC